METSANTQAKIGYVFGPQASQYAGMGKDFYDSFPKFREKFDEMNLLYKRYSGGNCLKTQFWSKTEIDVDLDSPDISSAGILAVQLSLVELLSEFGVKPSMILSLSFGEYAADVTAGIMSAADGMKLVVGRGQILKNSGLPEGHLTLVNSTLENVELLLKEFNTKYPNLELDIAAINAVDRIGVGGTPSAVDAFENICEESNVSFLRLSKSGRYAYHTRAMEPTLTGIYDLAKSIEYHSPQIPTLSSSVGREVSVIDFNPTYWVHLIRQKILFARAAQAFLPHVDVVLEIGPRPMLAGLLIRNGTHRNILTLMDIQPKKIPFEYFLHSLSWMSLSGYPVNWTTWLHIRGRELTTDYPSGFGITVKSQGFDNLAIESLDHKPSIGPTEVEIEVKFCSLNYQDKVICLESEFTEGKTLGFEVSGIISRVGAGVAGKGLNPKDHATAVVTKGGGISSHVVVAYGHVKRHPDWMKDFEASTISWTSLIAWKALVTLGGVRSGSTVLVNYCRGWIGLPLIQIAQHFGATVHALVASPPRKHIVESMGVEKIYNVQEGGKWLKEILVDTNNTGLSFVVNSFPGDAEKKQCLEILEVQGKFLDISSGGRDGWWEREGSKIRPDVTYFKINIEKNESPEWIAHALDHIWAGVGEGWIKPIPSKVFPIDCLGLALEWFHSEKLGLAKSVIAIPTFERNENDI